MKQWKEGNEVIKIGMIGIGAIAENYINLFYQGCIEGGAITALSSRNQERMNNIIDKYELTNVNTYNNYEDLFRDQNIDMVIICTPHQQHIEIARKALEAGIHPLIEKPVGVFASEIELLLEESRGYPELKMGVLYCRRMSSVFQKANMLIKAGAIGKLKRGVWIITNLYRTNQYHQSSSWRGTYLNEGGGILMTQASHQLDIFLWLCGMPKRVQGFCGKGMEREIEVENDVTIYMEFEHGATGQFITSSREYPGTNRLELIGDEGQLIIENDQHIILNKLCENETHYAKETTEYFGKIEYCQEEWRMQEDNEHQQAAIISDFIRSISEDCTPVCTVEEAIKSVEIINAVYLSDWTNSMQTLPISTKSYKNEFENHVTCKGK